VFDLTHELKPLMGLYAWSARRTHGSFLTLQFGEPRLSIRQPLTSSRSARRRLVRAVGQWEIWIEQAVWRLDWGAGSVTSDDDQPVIEQALINLDGQALTDFRNDETARASSFHFDLGAVLSVSPDGSADEPQWHLSHHQQWIASYMNDGRVEVQRVDTTAR